MTGSYSNNMNEEKSSILKRHKSQLFQHVTKIGLKRSHTTKAPISPQTDASCNNSKSQHLEKKNLIDLQVNNATKHILSLNHRTPLDITSKGKYLYFQLSYKRLFILLPVYRLI